MVDKLEELNRKMDEVIRLAMAGGRWDARTEAVLDRLAEETRRERKRLRREQVRKAKRLAAGGTWPVG